MSAENIRINQEIKVTEVRLISEDGDMVGIVPIKEALRTAFEANLDLIEISPKANPPVCKVGDFGKYKYQLQKKDQGAKKSKGTITKEVLFSPKIERGDFETKIKHVADFLEEGYKVKITSRIKGRDWGLEGRVVDMLERIKTHFSEVAIVQEEPRKMATGFSMLLTTKKKT